MGARSLYPMPWLLASLSKVFYPIWKKYKKAWAVCKPHMLIIGALAATGLSGCSRPDPGPIGGDIAPEIRKMSMAPIFEITPDKY